MIPGTTDGISISATYEQLARWMRAEGNLIIGRAEVLLDGQMRQSCTATSAWPLCCVSCRVELYSCISTAGQKKVICLARLQVTRP